MPKRTPDNCSIIKKYGDPGRCGGKCNGFAVSDANDEPCDSCKRCTYCMNYEAEDEYLAEVEQDEESPEF